MARSFTWVVIAWAAFACCLLVTAASARLELWAVFAAARPLAVLTATAGVIVSKHLRVEHQCAPGTRRRRRERPGKPVTHR